MNTTYLVTRTYSLQETYAHVELLDGTTTLLTRKEYDEQSIFVSPLSSEDVNYHGCLSLPYTKARLMGHLKYNLEFYAQVFGCEPSVESVMRRVKKCPQHILFPLTMN